MFLRYARAGPTGELLAGDDTMFTQKGVHAIFFMLLSAALIHTCKLHIATCLHSYSPHAHSEYLQTKFSFNTTFHPDTNVSTQKCFLSDICLPPPKVTNLIHMAYRF